MKNVKVITPIFRLSDERYCFAGHNGSMIAIGYFNGSKHKETFLKTLSPTGNACVSHIPYVRPIDIPECDHIVVNNVTDNRKFGYYDVLGIHDDVKSMLWAALREGRWKEHKTHYGLNKSKRLYVNDKEYLITLIKVNANSFNSIVPGESTNTVTDTVSDYQNVTDKVTNKVSDFNEFMANQVKKTISDSNVFAVIEANNTFGSKKEIAAYMKGKQSNGGVTVRYLKDSLLCGDLRDLAKGVYAFRQDNRIGSYFYLEDGHIVEDDVEFPSNLEDFVISLKGFVTKVNSQLNNK